MDAIQMKARIRKADIVYVDALFEAYGDLAVVTTLDPEEAEIEFLVSPSFISETKELLEALKKEIGLEMID